ncbi:MAG TPA: LuxR C-terminal-related transcriptional regulator [Steroidobacteraceae bacterium]|nr:LuxR C-terminal-related transcriptional regulator [Steroidobacteraceae bacterium]
MNQEPQALGEKPRAGDPLERAREAFAQHAWADAYAAYAAADTIQELGCEDLERLALAACLMGRERDSLQYHERAHRAHLQRNDVERAARNAFWIALLSLLRRETAQSNAWVARGERLIEGCDCVEHGYLKLPAIELALRTGNPQNAHAMSHESLALGERYREPDLVAVARHCLGRASIKLGEVPQGLNLLDETMLAVVAGELSPIVTGLLYCSIIDACREVYEWSRAREWTAALSRWCERQAGMFAFTDVCFVHRAEILCLQGAWPEAMQEMRRVLERERAEYCDRAAPGSAFYQLGEVHRLRGEEHEAEQAYRAASLRGFEPQPGLALLRLAQGRTDAASASMRRLMEATSDRIARGRLLPAHFEVMLAAGDPEEARRACEELESLCDTFDAESLRAHAAQARGILRAHGGDAGAALGPLREAFTRWETLGAPYDAARVRLAIADACATLGDDEAAALEREAARHMLDRLGAPIACEPSIAAQKPRQSADSLTAREREVLRLVAAGQTNKSIARRLNLSERTIDRHVCNILAKLNVPSRAAAAAHATAHHLL